MDVLFTVCFTLNASAFCIILWDFTCVSSFLSWILADEAFRKLTYLFLLLLCNFNSWKRWQNQQTTPLNLSPQKFFLRGSSWNNYWIRIWLALVFSFNYEFFLSIMNLEIKKKVLVVFGLSYTDLHVFKMKRPIGRAKNQSFISISLVISSSTCTLSLNSPIPVELLWLFTLPSLIKWNHLGQMSTSPLPIVKFHFSVPSHSFNQDFYIGVAQGWQNSGWDKRTCLFLFTCLFLSGLGDHCLRPSVKSFISSCLGFWLQSFFTPILQHNLPNQDFHQLILQWLPNASKGQCHRLTPAVQPPHTFQRLITHVSS